MAHTKRDLGSQTSKYKDAAFSTIKFPNAHTTT